MCADDQLFGSFGHVDTVDEACGAGTSDVELTASGYLQVFSDAIELLSSTGQAQFIIPEDEISNHCQVGWVGCAPCAMRPPLPFAVCGL